MKRSVEFSQLAQHQHGADAVFDALGFGGEASGYDSLRSLTAIKGFLEESIETDPPTNELGAWLVNAYRRIEAGYGEQESDAASVMLGYAVGKKVMDRSSVGGQDQCKLLIDRAYQNLTLAREVHGWGDDNLFYGALLEMACAAPGIYEDRQHMKHVRGLVRYAAAHQSRLDRRRKHEVTLAKVETDGPSWRDRVVYSLGLVGMMYGGAGAVPPPDETRDELEGYND